MSKLLSLVMIVRDEAHCIARTLESIKDYVDDYVILDTGSTDQTIDVARKTMGDVPGVIVSEGFVDFAASRNRALQIHAEGADPAAFTLTLSADEVVEGADILRKFLEEYRDDPSYGAFSVEMNAENTRWFYPRVLRTGAGWKYKNPVHEVPVGPSGETHGPILTGVRVVHHATDVERRQRRIRDFDLPLLQKLVEDEIAPLEDRAQSIWFLAQTHEALADSTERVPGGPWISHKLQAMANYWRRVELAGVDQTKTHYALFRYLNVAEGVGFYTHEELLNRLDALAELEPRLPEVRYMIAVHAAQVDARQGLFYAEESARIAKEVLQGEPLHVPTDVRLEWLSLRIAAGCAKTLGRHDYARRLAQRGVAAGGPEFDFAEFMVLPVMTDGAAEMPVETPAVA